MGLIQKISQQTGVPQQKVLQYTLVGLVLFVVFGIGSAIITNLIGVAYPCFMSFYALESDGGDDDKQWLTYWVVFGIFTIADQFAGFILSFIPFYYVLKVAVLIWLFHPSTKGAIFVYENYIEPIWEQNKQYVEQFEKGVEKAIHENADAIKSKVNAYKQE
eukprot:403331166